MFVDLSATLVPESIWVLGVLAFEVATGGVLKRVCAIRSQYQSRVALACGKACRRRMMTLNPQTMR